MNKFSKNLRELREESNLSMLQLAKEIETSDASICKWENGINEPKLSYLIRIAKFFNLSLDELTGIDENSDDFGNITISPSVASVPALSEKEKEVIDIFRAIPDNTKEVALTMLRSLAPQNKEKSALNKRA